MNEKRPGPFTALATGVLIAVAARFFCVDVVKIQGSSMEPTLHNGQLAGINRLAYGLSIPFSDRLLFNWNRPKTGDTAVFMHQENLVVKRVAATENQLLEFSRDSHYNLLTGGKTYPLSELQYNLLKDCSKVPQGMVFMVGDNPENSIDSRDYGFVPVNNVLGRVFF